MAYVLGYSFNPFTNTTRVDSVCNIALVLKSNICSYFQIGNNLLFRLK